MKRNTLNLVVDAVTIVVMLAVAWTGLVLKYVLPTGSPRLGWALFGWGRHDWGGVHFWLTVSLGVLLVVHLALHWTWVCTTLSRVVFRKKSGAGKMRAWERNYVGIAALVIVVGGMTGLVNGSRYMVKSGEDVRPHRGRELRQQQEASLVGGGEAAAGEGRQQRIRGGQN